MKLSLAFALPLALVGLLLSTPSCIEIDVCPCASGGSSAAVTSAATGTGGAAVSSATSSGGAGGSATSSSADSASASSSTGAPAGTILLPIGTIAIAPPGAPCGTCGEILGGTVLAQACNQATQDIMSALQACSCAINSACNVACSATVQPDMSLQSNWCEHNHPLPACKACLATSAFDVPPGCAEAFTACIDDAPPTPPFVCSEAHPDLYPCGVEYTTPPPCDGVITIDCYTRGDLICDVGYDWWKCCVTDDSATGDVCVPAP